MKNNLPQLLGWARSCPRKGEVDGNPTAAPLPVSTAHAEYKDYFSVGTENVPTLPDQGVFLWQIKR